MKYGPSKMPILLAAVLTVFIAGCQSISKEDLDEVRALAQQAQQSAASAKETADQAKSTADEANSSANEARSIAEDARSQASDAQAMARETQSNAQACCSENSQRVERMFESIQQK